MLTPEFKTSNIGIAIRVVNNKKMTASEICNLYWQSANLKGKVFFGTNVPIDVNKKSAIKKLFLFANNSVERFLCCATVEKVFIMCNPVEEGLCSKELLLSEDKTKQYKNWFLVSGFEQV